MCRALEAECDLGLEFPTGCYWHLRLECPKFKNHSKIQERPAAIAVGSRFWKRRLRRGPLAAGFLIED